MICAKYIRYQILVKKIPKEKANMHSNIYLPMQNFSVKMFQFLKPHDYIYIYIRLYIKNLLIREKIIFCIQAFKYMFQYIKKT